jgi:hypothetical protein
MIQPFLGPDQIPGSARSFHPLLLLKTHGGEIGWKVITILFLEVGDEGRIKRKIKLHEAILGIYYVIPLI